MGTGRIHIAIGHFAVFTIAVLLLLSSCDRAPTSADGATIRLAPNGATASLPPSPNPPLFNLDSVGTVMEPFSKQPVPIPADGELTLRGFAVDRESKSAAGGVDVTVDGMPFIAHYGIARPDVAEYFKVPAYAKAGFLFSMPAKLFGKGTHQIAVRVIASDKTTYYQGPVLTVDVR